MKLIIGGLMKKTLKQLSVFTILVSSLVGCGGGTSSTTTEKEEKDTNTT